MWPAKATARCSPEFLEKKDGVGKHQATAVRQVGNILRGKKQVGNSIDPGFFVLFFGCDGPKFKHLFNYKTEH